MTRSGLRLVQLQPSVAVLLVLAPTLVLYPFAASARSRAKRT